jgi:hypothetical protein
MRGRGSLDNRGCMFFCSLLFFLSVGKIIIHKITMKSEALR